MLGYRAKLKKIKENLKSDFEIQRFKIQATN